MPSLLAKGLSSSFLIPPPLSPSHHLYNYHHHVSLLSPPLRITLSGGRPPKVREKIPFIADYLVDSFGFSFDRALKVAATDTHLAEIKSNDRPDSVVRFLEDMGLSDSQIKTIISSDPVVLSYSVNKLLRPWARQLMAAGFSSEILVELIVCNPKVLSLKNPVSRVQFWREFVGNDDENLLRVIQRNRFVFYCDIEEYVVPRLNLFREFGLSDHQIVSLLMTVTRLMSHSLDKLRWILEQTQELRLNPGSTLFFAGILALGMCTKDTLNQKIELLKSYGLSEDDVLSALRKYPRALNYSEERIKSNMDFLIRKVGLDLRTIVSQPSLIGFSMEERVMPRHHVLNILKAHGLKKRNTLHSACLLSEERFFEELLAPHEKDVPGLWEAYAAALCGKVSL